MDEKVRVDGGARVMYNGNVFFVHDRHKKDGTPLHFYPGPENARCYFYREKRDLYSGTRSAFIPARTSRCLEPGPFRISYCRVYVREYRINERITRV